MKTRFLRFATTLFAACVLFAACEKDPEGEGNEEEVITTLQLTFTPTGGNPATFQFDDPDGPGGANPVQNPIALAANTTYNVSLQLLDKTKTPVANITTEVEEEGDAHRIYFAPSAGSNITVSGLNNDADGVPLGTTSTWTTGATATGTVKVTLRHYAGNPPGKETADPVNSNKSATDIEVTFVTTVQ